MFMPLKQIKNAIKINKRSGKGRILKYFYSFSALALRFSPTQQDETIKKYLLNAFETFILRVENSFLETSKSLKFSYDF